MRRLIVSPVFAGAVGVLLLNDRVLKAAWPGFVTGKLSDVAGVVIVAILLSAGLRSARAAFVLTVVGFTALKTVTGVAVLAAPVLGGVTRTDPTDLSALVALVPLWVWVHRDSDRPGSVATWTAPIKVALLGAAVFAISATSCDVHGVTEITEHDGVLYVGDTGGSVYSSVDGLEWQRAGGRWQEGLPTDSWTKREDCLEGRCFSIDHTADGVAVIEVGVDAPLLELSRDQQRALADIGPQDSCADVFVDSLEAFDPGDGVRLVVPTGSTGVLTMSPDGQWRWAAVGSWGLDAATDVDVRLGFDIASEPDEPPLRWGAVVAAMIPALVLIVGIATAVVLARRAHRVGGRRIVIAVGAAVVAVPFVPLYVALLVDDLDGSANDIGSALGYLAIATIGAAAFAMALAIANKWAQPQQHGHLPPPDETARVG